MLKSNRLFRAVAPTLATNGSGIAFVGKQSRIVKRFDNRGNTMFYEVVQGAAVRN